jgi:hypothetical protein
MFKKIKFRIVLRGTKNRHKAVVRRGVRREQGVWMAPVR